jgi:hypothetical protein
MEDGRMTRTRKLATIGFVGAALLLAGGAYAVEINSDFDKDANFGAIQTFAVKMGTGWGNPISEKRVVEEVGKAIAGKGWKPAEESAADALVVLHGATQEKQTLTTFYDGWGGYGWHGWGGMSMGSATTTSYEYTEGTLVVDVFDAKSKQLMWRGSATDQIKNTAEKREKQLAKAVTKLFYGFPPKAPKK